MFSARAAVARAARGRLDHGRRQLNRQLRAAESGRLLALVNATNNLGALPRLRQQRRVLESLDHGLLALDARAVMAHFCRTGSTSTASRKASWNAIRGVVEERHKSEPPSQVLPNILEDRRLQTLGIMSKYDVRSKTCRKKSMNAVGHVLVPAEKQ